MFLHQTMQMGFVFVLKMFQDKFIRNRHRLHCDVIASCLVHTTQYDCYD